MRKHKEDTRAAQPMSARYARWVRHLNDRGTATPDTDDFASFGSLSTLERLRAELAMRAPHHCGPLTRVISDLKRVKTKREGSKATGAPRGVPPALSIPAGDLRLDWRRTIEEMRTRRDAIDQGMVDVGAESPPAASQIRAIEYTLRSVSKVCVDHDRMPEIELDMIEAWVARQTAGGQGETGIGMQLRQIVRFLRYRAEKKSLRRRLTREAARLARIARLKRKRKHEWLLQNPTDIGKVWSCAERLLADSRAMAPGTARRYLRALHAAALALPVAAPLRIGDLSRLRIGREIVRDANGWALTTRTRKTGGDYDRPELWPELTPYLDELLILEAPGGDLWTGYDRRTGTPLFSRDGGESAMTADWISDVWYEHIGIGEHIVRTLWHQLAYDSDVDRTWMALALCGQSSVHTSKEYHDRNQRARAVRGGRKLLMAARQGSRHQHLQGRDRN